MKTKLTTSSGEGREIELPQVFSSVIRADICQKCYEIEKVWQPFAPEYNAGKKHSASGKIKKVRKAWKTGYGKGISRVPRKIFWRRGTQFYWVAAEVASTRGGRRAHPPRVEHFTKRIKINKKEKKLAMNSGIAATASLPWINKRYKNLETNKKLPVIIDSSILKLKAKEFHAFLKKYLPDKNILIVLGKDEKFKLAGLDIKKVNELKMEDLYPLGRLAIYTEQAVKELGVEQSRETKINKLTNEVGREKK
ncbi:MAG: 50S ribosomal protein L4 [Candidatus Pacearchaeota archaeon]|nr:50S ribosomal protein L4 [Candidatus Pacearchaeota archaeon]